MDKNFLKRGCAGLALAATGVISSPALAQNQNASARDQNQNNWALEEVVVTARKRSENLQDVGLAVSAIGQSELERKFSTDIRDLVDISPNLVIDDTAQGPGGVASIYIRGVGVSEVEKNFDPAVGVVVDGIFLGQMSGGLTRSIDLESVEVLRGPQGTVFGRNTIGGVIKLEHTRPTKEFGVKMRGSYGHYQTLLLDTVVNFGIGENLGVKLSGTYRDQGKGFYTNANTGRDEGRIKYKSFGVNMLWTGEDVEFEYTLQLEDTDQDTPPLLNVGQPGQLFCDAFGFCSPDTRTPVSGSRYVTLQNGVGPNDATFNAQTNIFEIRWDINDDYKFDYIFGIWATQETVLTDWDGLPPVLFHTTRPAEYRQASHEARITHDSGGPFTWVAGIYKWNSRYQIRLRSFIGFAVPGVILDLPQTSKQKTDSWAAFFEGDYAFFENLVLTLGGRFTKDKKHTDQSSPPGGSAILVNAQASDKWKKFTPRAGLKYHLNEDVMLYTTYSKGYRAGGFNGRVDSVETAITPYNAEVVDNYEVGFKTEWPEQNLRFNGDLFYMDYKNKQEELQLPSATSGTGQVTKVVNASNATMKGIEVDMLWSPVEGLNLRGNLGYLDAKYKSFEFEGVGGTVDLSHLKLRRAPKLTVGLSGSYERPIGDGMAWIGGGWRYIGAHEVDFANKPELHNRAQNLLDASVGYRWKSMEVAFYARNITKEDGYSIGFDVAGLWSYAATRAPRTYSVEVNFRFGE